MDVCKCKCSFNRKHSVTLKLHPTGLFVYFLFRLRIQILILRLLMACVFLDPLNSFGNYENSKNSISAFFSPVKYIEFLSPGSNKPIAHLMGANCTSNGSLTTACKFFKFCNFHIY